MSSINFAKRRNHLAESLDQSATQAFLICHPVDIAYLTGVDEGVSLLVVWQGGGFAITRHMLIREVQTVLGDFELLLPSERSTDRVNLEEFVVSQFIRRGIKQVLVDPTRMNAASYKSLETKCPAAGLEIKDAPSSVSRLRRPISGLAYFEPMTSPCSVSRICPLTVPGGCARMAW